MVTPIQDIPEHTKNRLHNLCKTFDPYNANNLSEEELELLKLLDIYPNRDNPFELTNKLLSFLDQVENKPVQ